MQQRQLSLAVLFITLAAACGSGPERSAPAATAAPAASQAERKYLLETVDDAAVVQLYADGFDALPLREKTLI